MMPESEDPTVWVVELEEDPVTGELFMPIPKELMESLGWQIGDTLVWDSNESQEITLSRKDS